MSEDPSQNIPIRDPILVMNKPEEPHTAPDPLNDRVRAEDVDMSDGINTETEAIASETGGLALASVDVDKVPEMTPEEEWDYALKTLPSGVMDSFKDWHEPERPISFHPDPRKLIKLTPVLKAAGVFKSSEDTSESDKIVIRNLTVMTRCDQRTIMSDEAKAEEAKLREGIVTFLESVSERGVSVRGFVELVRTKSNMTKIMDLYNQDPGAIDDSTSPLGLLLRMSNLPLYSLAEVKNDETYYANTQGYNDSRDAVIAEILETAEKAQSGSEFYTGARDEQIKYITELEAAIPALQAVDFPLEMIGKTLLDKFNTAVRMNNPDDEYEQKVINRCLEVGGKIRELKQIDPAIAKEALFGHDDLKDIVTLADSLEQIKRDEPEVYRILTTFRQLVYRVGGIREIGNHLAICRGLVNTPALYELIKDEKIEYDESTKVSYLPKNLKMLAGMHSLYSDSDRLEVFFRNSDALSDLIADERIDTSMLLIAADILEPDQIEGLLEIMKSADIQSAFSDPELNEYMNDAIGINFRSLDRQQVLRALELFKSIDKKEYFPLGAIIATANQHYPGEKTDEPTYQDLFFAALEKAAKNADKDGYPYDSVEAIGDALKFVMQRSSTYDNPQAVAIEMFKWFEASGLPYSALPTVVGYAEEAERDGVPFEPMAVYKWVYENAARVERVSKENLHEYVASHWSSRNEDEDSPETIIAEAEASAIERGESFRVLMNISDKALLAAVQKSGDLDSIFDSVEMTDRGAKYKLRRSGVEIALGIRSLGSDTEHAVYGSCAFIDNGVPKGAIGYGSIVLVFDPGSESLAGTTFTPEDSFHGARRLTLEDAKTLRQIKDSKGIGYGRTDEYIEAQIPGRVTLYDAMQIVVNSEESADELRAQLPAELAEKIVVR